MLPDHRLRDFLYLDMERVRSYVAQLLEGVPESRTHTSGTDATARGEIEGSIPLLTKGKAGGDYRYFRSEDETKSLHHHVYTVFEQRLTKANAIRSVDAGFAEREWSASAFRDGEIVRVTGEVRIIDYRTVVETVRALPGFAGLMTKVAKFVDRTADTGAKGVQQQQQKIDLGVGPKEIDIMAQLIERLFGDTVRVKVRPSATRPQNTFAAVALRSGFQDGVWAVQQGHGLDLGGTWVVVGQVNSPRPNPDEQAYAPFTTGNGLEDGLEQIVAAMEAMRQTTSGVRFPCISMNVISIYREC
jgi:hypothetical protein